MNSEFSKHYIFLTLILFIVVIAAALSFGSFFINIFDFENLNGIMKEILLLRSYRIMMAFTVGGALAVAGTGYQALLRNPLADPFILGISGGASIGAALAIVTGFAALSFFTMPLFAFAGSVIVLILVLFLARGAGIEYSNNVMLSGIIVGTVCSSILMFIISFLNFQKLNSITWWMLGNLEPDSNGLLLCIFILVIIGTLILFIFSRQINIMSLGEEMAYYLGISPMKLALIILGISSLLTASVVSISGIIGFVGLIVPHVLRKLIGADHRKLIPFSLLYGGLFLVVCDTFARSLFAPQVLPVGVVTAVMGGPFFLWILNSRRKIL